MPIDKNGRWWPKLASRSEPKKRMGKKVYHYKPDDYACFGILGEAPIEFEYIVNDLVLPSIEIVRVIAKLKSGNTDVACDIDIEDWSMRIWKWHNSDAQIDDDREGA